MALAAIAGGLYAIPMVYRYVRTGHLRLNALITFHIFMPPSLPSRPPYLRLPQEAQLSLYFVVALAPPEQGLSSSLVKIGLFASTIPTIASLSLGLGLAAQDTHCST